VTSYPNNSRIADFFCPSCDEGYELKSQRRPFRTKIVDGSYPAMMERLAGGRNPNFLLLAYDARRLSVLNFFVVPKHFFSAEIIEKKRTLPATARRLDGLQHRSTRNPYRRTNFFSAQWYHRASGTSDGDVA